MVSENGVIKKGVVSDGWLWSLKELSWDVRVAPTNTTKVVLGEGWGMVLMWSDLTKCGL